MNVGIPSAFEVLGENDNERRMIDFCAEKRLHVGNTYFEGKFALSIL